MTTKEFLLSAWNWHPAALIACVSALVVYSAAWRAAQRSEARQKFKSGRVWLLPLALAIFLLTLVSPLDALADGYLFSAHMLQHLLLLLVVPPLLLLSWPPRLRSRPAQKSFNRLPRTPHSPGLAGGCGGDVVVACAGIMQCRNWQSVRAERANCFPAGLGHPLLATNPRATIEPAASTACGNTLSLYSLCLLHAVGHHHYVCTGQRLPDLHAPGGPAGHAAADSRRLGPHPLRGSTDRRPHDVGPLLPYLSLRHSRLAGVLVRCCRAGTPSPSFRRSATGE